jgi:exonuclease SbcC
VISLGAQRARVRFQFSVDGTVYSATRVVQRTKSGATTNEARLEGGPEVVVGAAELTDAVERLLGLTYEHFTKSVVLPQGKFASFLLDGSSDRQSLLRELLDLGRYSRVRDLAVQRSQASEVRAESLRDALRQLDGVTAEAVAELAAAVSALDEVIEWSAGERVRLDRMRAEHASAVRETELVEKLLESLRSIELPDGLRVLDEQMSGAIADRAAATSHSEMATGALDGAQAAAEALGDPAEVAQRLGLVEQAEKLAERIAEGEQRISELGATLAAVVGEEEKLTIEAGLAQGRLERLQTEHSAHALRLAARVGDPCPVCRRTLQAEHLVADEHLDSSLAEAAEAAKAAAGAAEATRIRRVSLGAQLEEFRAQLGRLTAERADVIERVDGQTRPALEAKRHELKAAADRLKAATEEASRSRNAVMTSEKRIATLTEQTGQFWTMLDRHRMAVTSLDPPEIARKDLGSEWAAFIEWRDVQLAEVEAATKRLAAEQTEQLGVIRSIGESMAARVAGVGVLVPGDSDPHELALVARAQTVERLERMRSDLERKVQSAAALEGFENDALIAKALANHLKVNGFERWLIEEVVHDLVLHANERLEQLSDGAYALAVEKSDFVIIDRLNADERRAPETLSGGETFVVSLALALSLADQMASISMSGTARLDSVFLDEGFGTLDSETLDTVAAVIHELGSDGRTVGLITHVSELAQQIPVRFEVSKRSGGARVQRVEA